MLMEIGDIIDRYHILTASISGSLADLVSRKGPLAEVVAAKIIKQVLACLTDCHASGVVVQDLELDHFVITSSVE